MNDQPNPADFSADERPREYVVIFAVQGTMTVKIKADSKEDAEAKAEEMADSIAEGSTEADLDEIDDVGVSDVYKSPPMYRVTRDGRPCQVSRLRPGDLPREPLEGGF